MSSNNKINVHVEFIYSLMLDDHLRTCPLLSDSDLDIGHMPSVWMDVFSPSPAMVEENIGRLGND